MAVQIGIPSEPRRHLFQIGRPGQVIDRLRVAQSFLGHGRAGKRGLQPHDGLSRTLGRCSILARKLEDVGYVLEVLLADLVGRGVSLDVVVAIRQAEPALPYLADGAGALLEIGGRAEDEAGRNPDPVQAPQARFDAFAIAKRCDLPQLTLERFDPCGLDGR